MKILILSLLVFSFAQNTYAKPETTQTADEQTKPHSECDKKAEESGTRKSGSETTQKNYRSK